MATTEQNNLTAAANAENESAPETAGATTGDWIKDSTVVRAYWKWITVKVKNKKTGAETLKQKVKFIAKAESEGQANWRAIENEKDKDGNPVWTFFSENSFQRHTIKTMDAFYALIPLQEGPEAFDQRAYIANAGIGYAQNSKLNSLAVEYQDNTGVNGVPPVAVHNQEDIDLAPYINEKPGRRIKTMDEKVKEMLLKSGYDAAKIAAFLASLQSEYAAAAASGTALPTVDEEEEEEGEEEGEEETPVA